MAGASGANVGLSYVREAVRGVLPAIPPAVVKTLRTTGRNINRVKGTLRSAERRADRQRAALRHGFRQVVGGLPFQLGLRDFDDVLEMALAATWQNITTGATTLEVTATGFKRPAGSFITEGFHLGQEINTAGFTNPANNGGHRITAIDADDITVDTAGLVVEAAAAGRTLSGVGRTLKVGNTIHTASIERRFPDIGVYELFHGCAVNGLSIALTPEAIVGGTLDIIGMRGTGKLPTTIGEPEPATENEPFDAFTGAIYEGDVELGFVTGLTFNLNNSRSVGPVLMRKESPDIYEGVAEIGGNMTIQFHDSDIVDKFEDELVSSIDVRMDDLNGTDFHRIRLPRIKYTADGIDPPASGPVIVNLPFDAEPDPVTGTSMIWQRSNV